MLFLSVSTIFWFIKLSRILYLLYKLFNAQLDQKMIMHREFVNGCGLFKTKNKRCTIFSTTIKFKRCSLCEVIYCDVRGCFIHKHDWKGLWTSIIFLERNNKVPKVTVATMWFEVNVVKYQDTKDLATECKTPKSWRWVECWVIHPFTKTLPSQDCYRNISWK